MSQHGKSDVALLFDFETDPSVFPPDRLRRVGRLGMLIGVPSALIGFGVSFALFVTFRSVNKLTGLPVFFGALMMGTGVYRFGLGLVPVLARSNFLRLCYPVPDPVRAAGGHFPGVLLALQWRLIRASRARGSSRRCA
jgi:hypothetical protein